MYSITLTLSKINLSYLSITVLHSLLYFFFFFSSRRRHTRFDCDWSSDVCSSDLAHPARARAGPPRPLREAAGPLARRSRRAASPGGPDGTRPAHRPQLASRPDRPADGRARPGGRDRAGDACRLAHAAHPPGGDQRRRRGELAVRSSDRRRGGGGRSRVGRLFRRSGVGRGGGRGGGGPARDSAGPPPGGGGARRPGGRPPRPRGPAPPHLGGRGVALTGVSG